MKFGKLFFFIAALFSLSQSSGDAAAQTYQGMTTGGFIHTEDAATLREVWGVNAIMFPIIVPYADSLSLSDYNAGFEAALERLDEVLPAFSEAGIKVIIKLYSPPGGFASTRGLSQHRVFAEQWAQAALFDVWRNIASRYRDSTTVIGYQILNEPAVGKKSNVKWTDLARQLVAAIRTIDTTHTIFVSTEYGNPLLINKLKPLLGIPNLAFVVHAYYLPYSQQGLYGKKPMNYSAKVRKKLVSELKPSVQFQRKYGAQILVGEFSVVRNAPGAAQFVNDSIQLFRSYGFDWFYHAYAEDPVWDATGTDQGIVLKSYFAGNARF